MADRIATDTIKGYFYQFDLSILTILELNNEDAEITVEGIEDIDVSGATEETAIQCKYHSKQEYKHSLIAKPIRLMLNHYKEVLNGNKKQIKYSYYGHFKSGQSKLDIPITLDFLKTNLLEYTKDKVKLKHYEDLNLTDKELLSFLNQLQVDINAKSYENQLSQIYSLIKKQDGFNADDFEAENYFYNNALKVISNLSIQENSNDRTISKKMFLKEINSKKVLFHRWFVEFKGKERLLKDLRSKFFSDFNQSPFERFFLLEIKSGNYIKSELKNVIFSIAEKWSNIQSKKDPDTFCPYVYIYGIDESELVSLKGDLINEGFKFKDGFDFSGSSFNLSSIQEKATYHNEYKIKIINDLNFIEPLLSDISKTKELYQFFYNTPFFSTENYSVKVVNIQIEELNDIKNII